MRCPVALHQHQYLILVRPRFSIPTYDVAFYLNWGISPDVRGLFVHTIALGSLFFLSPELAN